MSAEAPSTAHLSAAEVRLIGDALFYEPWQTAMAEAVGVSRQTVAHYLREGVTGAQAAALIGLVARRIVEADAEHARDTAGHEAEHLARRREKAALLDRFHGRLG
jgi:hypothetical protein